MKASILKLLTWGKSRCNCALCRRSRRYYRNTAKLKKAERDWMRGFYDAVMDSEEEAAMQRAAKPPTKRKKLVTVEQ